MENSFKKSLKKYNIIIKFFRHLLSFGIFFIPTNHKYNEVFAEGFYSCSQLLAYLQSVLLDDTKFARER